MLEMPFILPTRQWWTFGPMLRIKLSGKWAPLSISFLRVFGTLRVDRKLLGPYFKWAQIKPFHSLINLSAKQSGFKGPQQCLG